jgi:hypothetical protein
MDPINYTSDLQYADEELHDCLVQNNLNKYFSLVHKKNKKNNEMVENEIVENEIVENNEEQKNIFESKYKIALIKSIFESFDNIDKILNIQNKYIK